MSTGYDATQAQADAAQLQSQYQSDLANIMARAQSDLSNALLIQRGGSGGASSANLVNKSAWDADPSIVGQMPTGVGHQIDTFYPYTSNPVYDPYGGTSGASTSSSSTPATTSAATATTPGIDPSISSSFIKRAAWGTDPNIGNQTPTGTGHQIRTVF